MATADFDLELELEKLGLVMLISVAQEGGNYSDQLSMFTDPLDHT